MANPSFHAEPYEAGTLTKLKIFEVYVQAWLPVFLARPEPVFPELYIFDLFCGPGADAIGQPGSPLRIVRQIQDYQKMGLAGWSQVKIEVHFSDQDEKKVEQLQRTLALPEWTIPGITPKVKQLKFREALQLHEAILTKTNAAKLLILDQFGVDAITEDVFKRLIKLPRTDFIFFLSSSTLHRFRNHPAIKIKIGQPEDTYDVHRAAFAHFKSLTGGTAFLGSFSIRKRSNIYGLIFGSQHPLGIHKFLQIAWATDEISGEANFDIDRENVGAEEMLLDLAVMRPQKKQQFEVELEAQLRSGKLRSEADIIRFSIESGMTCQHCSQVIQKLKSAKAISCEFRTPDVRNFKKPRGVLVI